MKGGDPDDVFDFNEAVPETERLDSKALKTRAQLLVKSKRQKPSRTRLCDSISSTDGEDSIERKLSDSFGSPNHIPLSPLSMSMRTCSTASDSGASSFSPMASSPALSFDLVADTQEEQQQNSTGAISQFTTGDVSVASPNHHDTANTSDYCDKDCAPDSHSLRAGSPSIGHEGQINGKAEDIRISQATVDVTSNNTAVGEHSLSTPLSSHHGLGNSNMGSDPSIDLSSAASTTDNPSENPAQ